MKRNLLKKGFTLVELMVVVGIIGILSAILLKTVSGSSESARAAKCLGHMHNLAAGCHAVGLAEDDYPAAGSREQRERNRLTRGQKSHTGERETYFETKGWVSWFSKGAYQSSSHKSSSSWFISAYSKDHEKWHYCLTNGAIWRAMNGSGSSYVCPHHQVKAKKWGLEPHWSYVMNSKFGYDETAGADSHLWTGRLDFNGLKKKDRILLFAEYPFDDDNTSQTVTHSTTSGTEFDPTLQYEKSKPSSSESGYHEVIGFNHKAKRDWYAHVCFADGHTEKLKMPGDTSISRLRELTRWLCEGTDFSYDGTKYTELDK